MRAIRPRRRKSREENLFQTSRPGPAMAAAISLERMADANLTHQDAMAIENLAAVLSLRNTPRTRIRSGRRIGSFRVNAPRCPQMQVGCAQAYGNAFGRNIREILPADRRAVHFFSSTGFVDYADFAEVFQSRAGFSMFSRFPIRTTPWNAPIARQQRGQV